VSVFFVLAGYGAFFSLKKRLGGEGGAGGKKAIWRYYLDRALRIYPSYWVALLLTAGYFPEYEMLHDFDLYTVAVYLGVPFVNAPGIFWFVPAIIFCYILAPAIYALLARVGVGRYLAILAATIPVSLAVTILYLSSADPDADIFTWSNLNILFYKDYFLSTVLLFSMGVVISPISSWRGIGHRIEAWSKALILPALLLFVVMLYLTRDSYSFYDQGYDPALILIAPVFIASCFALCLLVIKSNMSLPYSRVTAIPGRYSYQLYLFHMLYIALLARFDLIKDNDLWSFMVFLGLLPLVLLIFMGIDYAFNSGGDSKAT
jgi:peptidoglycan/LPS O-acetylase OafA/YrhL